MMKKKDSAADNRREVTGLVFEIERYAINDGPGVRTIVFLKGCPLRCIWCANPESQKLEPQIMWWRKKCMGCARCAKQCPSHALAWKNGRIVSDNDKCTRCGVCEDICNSEAIEIVGRRMTVEEVVRAVDKDAAYYQNTEGGVTFSGGEPFVQHEFLHELAVAAKARGYHTAVETCGYSPWENIAKILPHIDVVLYDFKCMDSAGHKKWTGAGNEMILENYVKITEAMEPRQRVIARIPVVPGLNTDMRDFGNAAGFLKMHNPQSRVDLLPYHNLATVKYQALDQLYQGEIIRRPEASLLEEIRELFAKEGFETTIGG